MTRTQPDVAGRPSGSRTGYTGTAMRGRHVTWAAALLLDRSRRSARDRPAGSGESQPPSSLELDEGDASDTFLVTVNRESYSQARAR
jgi:hypothetical protein